mgnify:CR=1 FL=1
MLRDEPRNGPHAEAQGISQPVLRAQTIAPPSITRMPTDQCPGCQMKGTDAPKETLGALLAAKGFSPMTVRFAMGFLPANITINWCPTCRLIWEYV